MPSRFFLAGLQFHFSPTAPLVLDFARGAVNNK